VFYKECKRLRYLLASEFIGVIHQPFYDRIFRTHLNYHYI
jgi:hypothetical protein